MAKTQQQKQPRDRRPIWEALKQLEVEHGNISPKIVVEAASDEDSPLHEEFEWADAKAANKWRLMQAYKLIAEYHTIRELKEGVPVDRFQQIEQRGFLPKRDKSNEFVSREAALNDPEIRQRNIEAWIAELEQWVRRTDDVKELSSLRAAIVKELKKLK